MSEEFAGLGCGDSDVEVGDEHGYGGVFVGSADADVVEFAVVAECDGACFVDAVVADSEVDVSAVVFGAGFGEPVVGGGWCGASEGSVGAVVVVVMWVNSLRTPWSSLRSWARCWAVSHFLRVCWKRSTFPQVEVCLSLPRSWGVESNLSFGFFGVVEMGSAVVVEPGLAGLL